MPLASLIRPELILSNVESSDRASLLRKLANHIASAGLVDSGEVLFEKLIEREDLESTAFGGGVAIPHCKIDGLDEVLVAIAVVPQGIDFAAGDGMPVQLFFCIVSPSNSPVAHLQSLAAISRWIQSEQRVAALLQLDDPQAIHDFLSTSES